MNDRASWAEAKSPTDLRLAMYRLGYHPVPVAGPKVPGRSPGKRPLLMDWRRICAEADEAEVMRWETELATSTNTGCLTGVVAAVDTDVPIPEMAERLDKITIALLGETPLRRTGLAPKFLRCYRTDAPMPKIATPEMFLPDGTKLQVEVLGEGQQFVAFGIHPDTEKPYVWGAANPLNYPIDDIPLVEEAPLRELVKVAEAIFRAAGARTKKEIDDTRRAKADAAEDAPRAKATPGAGGDNFFREVNNKALTNIGPWLSHIFPTAKQEAGTGAWRVKSADIGRDTEEDLSVHPDFGCRDFGAEKSMTAIDLVIEHTGAPMPQDAAFLICEKLGISPTSLGWKGPKAEKAKSAEPGEDPPPHPLDFLSDQDGEPPELTRNHIPFAIWPFVTDTAERMGVNASSVALGCLVTSASVISEEWCLQPKRHDYTWTENARLWGLILGPPSVLKTPIISACTHPVDKLDAQARRRHQEDSRFYKAEHAAWKKNLDPEVPEPRAPKLDRYMVEGCTVEALSEVLRDDDEAKQRAPAGKVLSRQDEMSEFFANMDRYKAGGKGGGDQGAHLRLFNGGRYNIDRIGRGSFAISSWSACVMGGIQPGPIQKIARNAAEDGMLQRFIYDAPSSSKIGVDRAPNRQAIKRYEALIPALAAMHPPRTQDGDKQNVVFAADAHQHREHIASLARVMAAMPDTSPRLVSAFGKWPGIYARLCLTFHLIDIADARASDQQGPPMMVITEQTARCVARYMQEIAMPNLLRADALMYSTDQTSHARWVAEYILAYRLDRITARDVVRGYRALKAPEASAELAAVMASLVTVGWLEPEAQKNTLKPVSSWLVNPAVHTLYAEEAEKARAARDKARADIAADVEAVRRRRQEANEPD